MPSYDPRAEPAHLPARPLLRYDTGSGPGSGFGVGFGFASGEEEESGRQRGEGGSGGRGGDMMMHAPLPACSGRIFTGPSSSPTMSWVRSC
ncbi:hypothetical protein SAMD00023353_0200140 [Rosellinia necatrix]|uniref:Uncharacterized protein n=1 Tax=Rosellinia necatrix TaxID=77044 RepID=A0A1S8A5Z3_ROSNE|nr:hypothetical protein SAMD00023353_0200140 [Rosellinia necatrix]